MKTIETLVTRDSAKEAIRNEKNILLEAFMGSLATRREREEFSEIIALNSDIIALNSMRVGFARQLMVARGSGDQEAIDSVEFGLAKTNGLYIAGAAIKDKSIGNSLYLPTLSGVDIMTAEVAADRLHKVTVGEDLTMADSPTDLHYLPQAKSRVTPPIVKLDDVSIEVAPDRDFGLMLNVMPVPSGPSFSQLMS